MRRPYLLISSVWVLLSIIPLAYSQSETQLDSRLQATITAVHSAKSPTARYDAAEQLPALTSKAHPESVQASTVTDLIALLDGPDDVVRMFAAGALGNLKAKAAIPKLTALLPVADCLEGDLTSARAIRFALQRMGVKPPPPPSYKNCHGSK